MSGIWIVGSTTSPCNRGDEESKGNIMRNAWLALAPFAISLLPLLLWAHHGWAEFDETKEISLNGTVTDFHFVNPHCVVEFDVTGEKGVIWNWQGEFSSPGPMARKG